MTRIGRLITEEYLRGDEILRKAGDTLAGTEKVILNVGGELKESTVQSIANLASSLWAGRISQSGTNNPTITTLNNPLGYTVVAIRNDVGNYSLYFSVGPAFSASSTLVLASGHKAGVIRPQVSTDNEIIVLSYNTTDTLTDAIINNTHFLVLFF